MLMKFLVLLNISYFTFSPSKNFLQRMVLIKFLILTFGPSCLLTVGINSCSEDVLPAEASEGSIQKLLESEVVGVRGCWIVSNRSCVQKLSYTEDVLTRSCSTSGFS